jgi:hypothetical protein
MTARWTKQNNGDGTIDLGCSLENFALSLTLRDLAQKEALKELEFLEVVAGCDGCDTRRECIAETGAEIDLSTEQLVDMESKGNARHVRDFR